MILFKGVLKTFKLTYEDCDPLEPDLNRHQCSNLIIAKPKRLTQSCFNYFICDLEEITVSVGPSGFVARTPEEMSSKTMFRKAF